MEKAFLAVGDEGRMTENKLKIGQVQKTRIYPEINQRISEIVSLVNAEVVAKTRLGPRFPT